MRTIEAGGRTTIRLRERSSVFWLSSLWLLCSCATHREKPAALMEIPVAPAHVDVLTQHGDSTRQGANLRESILTPAEVGSGRFQRLFEWPVDGQIYGQPLYVSHVEVGGQAMNLVIVTTMNNSLYAFQAPDAGSDQQPSGKPLWVVGQNILGDPLPFDYFSMNWAIIEGYNIDPLIGIVSTPVIDRERGVVYVTSKSGSGKPPRNIHYTLFGFELATGKLLRSVEVAAQYPGPDQSKVTFDATRQMQRAALLEANGRIYLAFASHQDAKPYHGWVIAYDADDFTQSGVFCTTCGQRHADVCGDSCEGGIWQAGGGPVADAAGNVYVMTGNGDFDAAVHDVSTSFVKLDPALHLLGSWTPPNHPCLSDTDSDLGSAGPLLIPASLAEPPYDILIGGGKEGLLYGMRTDSLDGSRVWDGAPRGIRDVPGDPCAFNDPHPEPSGPGRSAWTIQAAPLWQGDLLMDALRLVLPAGLAPGFHHIHGAPVLWTVHDPALGQLSLLYMSAERDLLRAYEFNQGFPGAAPVGKPPVATFESSCPNSHKGMPGGFLTLSANGGDPDSGIIWAAMPRRNQDALNEVVPGVLRAYRAHPATTGGKLTEIWNSDEGAAPASDRDCDDDATTAHDELGLFAKFVSPTVSEGKVYMATFSNQLVVYGLKGALPRNARLAPSAAVSSRLVTNALPASVAPNDQVAVSVTVTNTSQTATWHAADGIGLTSRFIPRLEEQVVGGLDALRLPRDVAPQQSYTFNFNLRMPAKEGSYYYKWRLKDAALEQTQKSGGAFGEASPPWRFVVQSPECADLRERAGAAVKAMPDPQQRQDIPVAQAQSINALIGEAKTRNCRLAPFLMGMETQTHAPAGQGLPP